MFMPKPRRLLAGLILMFLTLVLAGTALAQQSAGGTLNVTCSPGSATDADALVCKVSLDGAPQPDIPAGQTAVIALAGGSHTVQVDLTGANAALWVPASVSKKVTIGANPVAFEAKFDKKGHLVVNLSQPGVTADFYLGQTQVATQAASVEMWIVPKTPVTVSARNVVDPAANGVYGWKDASQSVTVKPGSDGTLTLKLVKQPIQGFLKAQCALPAAQPTDNVLCHPTLDGAAQPDIAPGQEALYPLPKGSHTIQFDLIGNDAHLWAPASASQALTIAAGATKVFKPKFTKSGHLIVNLDQPGVVGDFYLDGAQVGAQVASVDMWVVPDKSHKIEVKNLSDPAAAGMWRWLDASATATVKAGTDKTVTIALKRVGNFGYFRLNCIMTYVPPPDIPAYCTLIINGVERPEQIAPNTSLTIPLAVGTYQMQFGLGPRGAWRVNDELPVYTITIVLSQTFTFNMTWWLNIL